MVHFLQFKNFENTSRGGETGIHAALRWLWEKSCRGSSPLLGTIILVLTSKTKTLDTCAGLANNRIILKNKNQEKGVFYESFGTANTHL
mgnify:CR=1 FL=1